MKRVRILGEDLILFRDASGRLGLIGDRCAHRCVDLINGIPETTGLRCPYHGWLYDVDGRCIEQPAEPVESTYKDKIKLLAYPVRELGGLVFAYLGNGPVPGLPRWDRLVWTNVIRAIGINDIQANWLQCMENSPDMPHAQWLHNRWYRYLLEREGVPRDDARYKQAVAFDAKVVKYTSDPFSYGFIKRTLLQGGSEEDDFWKVGQPQIFPGISSVSSGGVHIFLYRVPIDDFSTRQYAYIVFDPGPEVRVPDKQRVPFFLPQLRSENGKVDTWLVRNQDALMMEAQGPIADRTKEHLASSDVGVVYFRKLLSRQIDLVENGETPMNVFRIEDESQAIELAGPAENVFWGFERDGSYRRGSATIGRIPPGPVADEVEDLFERAAGERQGRRPALR